MSGAFEFLDVADVEAIHELVLAEAGGTAGVRDRGMLESAVMAVRNSYAEEISELAAVLAFSLANNHPFLDGNKRTAFTAAATFLAINGYSIGFDVDRWEAIIVSVASGGTSKPELAAHFARELEGFATR